MRNWKEKQKQNGSKSTAPNTHCIRFSKAPYLHSRYRTNKPPTSGILRTWRNIGNVHQRIATIRPRKMTGATEIVRDKDTFQRVHLTNLS